MGVFDKNLQNKTDTGAICPHCKTILIPPPKRKSKCPRCEKDIFVRTDPFNKSKTYYLNMDNAYCLDMLRNTNITEKVYSEAIKKAKPESSIGDIVWGLVSQEKQKAARKGDWFTVANFTDIQARYYYLTGRDYFKLLQQGMKERLTAELGNCTHVQISSCRDDRTCKKCASQNGVKLTIQEAIETMPIPMKCDNGEGWCRCTYTYSTER